MKKYLKRAYKEGEYAAEFNADIRYQKLDPKENPFIIQSKEHYMWEAGYSQLIHKEFYKS